MQLDCARQPYMGWHTQPLAFARRSRVPGAEFKNALKRLGVTVPLVKMRALFAMFDEDETGQVDYMELCAPRQLDVKSSQQGHPRGLSRLVLNERGQ